MAGGPASLERCLRAALYNLVNRDAGELFPILPGRGVGVAYSPLAREC